MKLLLNLGKLFRISDSCPGFKYRATEAYGMALQSRRRYKSFLLVTVEEWLQLISRPLVASGYTPEDARAFATVILGGLRGFMLDYSNTRDRKRVDRAVALWARALDRMLPECQRRK
jgi:hypothetical protein